jgi:hypothetical protein
MMEEDEEVDEVLLEYYGTLDRSILSLYQAIADGIHWAELLEPLYTEISPYMALVFATYFGFMVFGLANIIGAFFVEAVMREASEAQVVRITQKLKEVFTKEIIDKNDFEACLYTEQMEEYLDLLEMPMEHACEGHLFNLMDEDLSGTLDNKELLNGCVKLTGSARAIDHAAFVYKYKQDFMEVQSHFEKVEEMLFAITSKLRQGGTKQAPDPSPKEPKDISPTKMAAGSDKPPGMFDSFFGCNRPEQTRSV